MRFKPIIWQPIAVVLSGLNLVGVGFAAGAAEPLHATAHAALALAFGFWARHLSRGLGSVERQTQLDQLEGEVSSLRQELTEAQERIDFAERLLAQGAEARRVGQER